MQRFIIERFLQWKDQKNRKPLILRGARQVGKTWIVKEFGRTHFKGAFHYVDLEKHQDWHRIFEQNLDVQRIISELELLLDKSIVAGKDLLFFDEVQNCPKAIMALRYFYEEMPQLHVMAAGSLLEFALNTLSFPVGRVQFLNMFPMSFTEFLIAIGKRKLADIILLEDQFSPAVHEMILSKLRLYFFIGGMPECVSTYSKTGKLKDVMEIQKQLIETYRADFSKYKPQVDPYCLNSVLTSVASSIGQKIKYTSLSGGFSVPTNKKAFEVLAMARLLYKIPSASPAGLPLGSSTGFSFKALMLDIGLMQHLCGLNISEEIAKKDLLDVYRGALAEQFVGQEFLAGGVDELYFWSREAKSSMAEVDFLIAPKGEIIPIEVKSGAAGKLRSLHLLLKSFPKITKGIVLSERLAAKIPEQKLIFKPLYQASRLIVKEWGQ